MAPKPKPAIEFTAGMVLAIALTILVVMTWAVAAPSSSAIYHPQLLLLYKGGRPVFTADPGLPLGHKDVRGQPLFALQASQRAYLVALHRGTLGEPFFALRTCSRPVASSTCDRCR